MGDPGPFPSPLSFCDGQVNKKLAGGVVVSFFPFSFWKAVGRSAFPLPFPPRAGRSLVFFPPPPPFYLPGGGSEMGGKW